MTASPDLERAAQAVLDQLSRDELDRVLAGRPGRAELAAAMAARARAVQGSWRGAFPPDREELLLVATLTRTAGGTGVQQSTGHVAERFEQLLRVPTVPPMVALAVGGNDSVALVRALEAAHRAENALRSTRAEPPLYLTIVAGAAAAIDPAHATDIASALLDRGAQLAAAFVARDAPATPAGLPVLGDPGFLSQLAGYGQAVREWRGTGATDPLSGVAALVDALVDAIRRHTTRPARHSQDDDGPDQAWALLAAAAIIGADDYPPARATADGTAAGIAPRPDGHARPNAQVIFRRLNRGLWQDWHERPRQVTPTDQDFRLDGSASGGQEAVLDAVDEPDELTAIIVAALVGEANREELARVADWVGRRRAPRTDELYPLLRGLRQLSAAVEGAPRTPRQPAEWDAAVLGDIIATVRAAVAAELARGPGKATTREVVAAVLPPLWAQRRPMISALTQRIKQDHGWNSRRDATARMLAARAVRGPGQFVADAALAQHTPAGTCVTIPLPLSDAERCEQRTGPSQPGWDDVCPARPWGEPGLVESRSTLADLLGRSPDAVRALMTRYRDEGGPWLELAHDGRAPAP